MGFLVLLLLAFIGGAILNLTPCVLPVIPLKILSLTKAAGSQSRSTALGIAMSLGIVTFWLALGLIIAASTSFKSASQLFGYWWFTLGMGLFIFFMGMGSMGLFNVGLPNWAYSLNPKLDSLRGSFFFGIVTAILGTPCIAPFMGGAIGWAVFQPTLTVLAVFTAVGLGMASPYLLLAMKPAWLSRLPKAGPGGDLLKQVLGLLLIAVSVFFIGIGLRTLTKQHPHLAGVLHWWIIAAVMIAAALWLSLRGLAINKRPLGKALIVALSALLAAAPILWARAQTRSASYADLWRHYTPQALAAARAANKTIVLDFTADWCANCKTLKAGVLDREAVRSVLAEKDVAAFEVDLTVTDETTDAWRLLKSYSRIAPPLLVIEGPGSADSFQSDAYTVANVLDALARRRRLAGGSKIGG
jgi:thiol:disulfide interchange protein DsbD